MEQMEKLHPSNAGLAALKAEPVRERAAVLLRDKKVDQAIEAYRTAFQLFPEHNALSNLGSALIAKKQLPEAIDVLTQPSTMKPTTSIFSSAGHGPINRSTGMPMRKLIS